MPNCLSTLSHNCFGTDVPDDIPVPQFKCYRLPSVVQGHVVKFMDKFDITQCSIVSPNFRARARTKLYLIHMEERIIFDSFDVLDKIWEVFDIDKQAPRIKISEGRKNVFIKFFWVEQKVQIDLVLEGVTRFRLSEDLEMAVVSNTIVIYNSNPTYSKLADYQFILDIIFGTFTVSWLRLGQDDDYIMPKEVLFPLAQRYKNLVKEFSLKESWNPSANLTSEELTALLDNMKVQELQMSWRAEPGAKYTGILKTKRMLLRQASWLTLDDLFSMECECLIAFSTLFTAQDLKAIVRKWQEGGFEKLKGLTLAIDCEDEEWACVLDNIEGTVLPTRYHSDDILKEVVRSDGKKFVMVASKKSFSLRKLSKYD